MALNSNIETLREIWHLWSIRGCITLSLSLQIFLFLFAPLRRKTGSTVFYFLMWSAYLLADWIPSFTAGLILKSLSTGTGSSVNPATGRPGVDDDLLALWAAYLLCHLGGSFTITAFALEDNELWFRHLIVMAAQFFTAFYVFLRTLPDKKLLVPTVFALLGGISSNALRIYSMHLASLDKYRKDLVTEPDSPEDAEADTTRCLEKLHEKDPSEPLHRLDVLLVAHHYFKIFKGLVVNVKRQLHEQEQIKEVFCERISSEDAYRIVSCELSYMYEVFYTNRAMFTGTIGSCCWITSVISSAVVLGRFARTEKRDFHPVDIRISNALVTVSFMLSLMVLYVVMYREKSVAILPRERGKSKLSSFTNRQNYVLSEFYGSKIRDICKSIRLKESEIKIEPDITHKIDGTPILFREWSESICSHNLISYCLKERPRCISRPYRPWVAQNCKIPHVAFQAIGKVLLFPGKLFVCRRVLDLLGLKDTLDRAMYVSMDPFDKDLWDFIFISLQSASTNNEAGKLISEAIGDCAPQNICDRSTSRSVLSYIKDVEYDESLLLWHIATELCYYAEDDDDLSDEETSNNRVFSKMLSDYMLYLMVFQPSMMSTISGTFLKRYSVSCEQITKFLLKIHLGGEDGRLKEACRSILDRRAEFPKTDSGKDGAATMMPRACTLTDELKNLPKGERWRRLSHAWFEMLIYAARNCKGDTHVRSLCRGGELLSLVWLLMAHFGFDMGHRQPVRVIDEADRTPSTRSVEME